jgi:hypothetical protein
MATRSLAGVEGPASAGKTAEVVDPPAFPHKMPFPEKIIKKLSLLLNS